MTNPTRSLIVVAVALLTTTLGSLTPASSKSRPPARVAGTAVECTDFQGRTVHLMRVTDLGDVARAWVVNRVPFIVMDRARLSKLPPKLQLFFYGHECAHHKMGHWMNTTKDSEREADCWSIKTGRDNGLFARDEVVAFAPWFARSRGSRYGHLPGPLRAKFLLRCYDDKDTAAAPLTDPADRTSRGSSFLTSSVRD